MMNYFTTKEKKILMVTALSTMALAIVFCGPNLLAYAQSGEVDLQNVTNPIIGLLNSVLKVLIPLVGAVGALYCVLLGVKFAKAEEPQEREKAKAHLRNAIIGFVLIFVLIVALRQALPIMEKWMSDNSSTKKTSMLPVQQMLFEIRSRI